MRRFEFYGMSLMGAVTVAVLGVALDRLFDGEDGLPLLVSYVPLTALWIGWCETRVLRRLNACRSTDDVA